MLAGIAIASLGGENGLIAKVMQSKEKYAISEAKEQLELEITNLQIEQEGKDEELKKEDLPKINSEKIDVKDTTNFPVEVIYEKYKFEVDENFKVTYVGEANGTIVTYTTEPKSYTNKDEVKILIEISNPKGIKSIQKPNEDDKILPQQQTTVGIDYTVTKNGHYIFKVVDMDNNEIEKDVYIDLIDRLEPLDFTISVNKGDEKLIIEGEAQDAEGDEEGNNTKSGIDYYEYYLVDIDNNIKKYTDREIETTELTGSYSIYSIAYDRAGNSKKSNTVSTQITVFDSMKVVSAGCNWTLGLDKSGNLWTLGDNSYGQLGDGTKNTRKTPVLIKKNTKFVQISSSNYIGLAIDELGNLWAWGLNIGTSPVQIGNGTKFTQISAGNDHCLAIDELGNLWAFGKNEYGQIGNGNKDKFWTYITQIKKGTKFTKISAGSRCSHAIDELGNLWAWGSNDSGRLGDGTEVNRTSPVQIKEGTKFKEISSHGHCLAIDELGNLWAWGFSNRGQVGNGAYGPYGEVTSPVQIKEGTKFKKISAGCDHSLAIDELGNLWAWGRNDIGLVGDGTKEDRSRPVQIKEGTKFTQISAGDFHSFATDELGNLWAWGRNEYGQLGDGTTVNKTSPVQI